MLDISKYSPMLEWLKKRKVVVILFSIMLFGAFLRLHNFNDLVRFNADQVRDMKIVEAMPQGEFPLLGPKAGGTTFKLGPAFYYLEYLSGLIFGFTPQGIALFIPFLSIASIFLFHFFFKHIFSAKITLLLTLLYASSFYLIKYSRFAWNPNAIPFFLFAFLNLMLAILLKKRPAKYHVALGILVGIGIQLHTTLLILLPLLTVALYAYIFFKDKKIPLVKIGATVLAIIFLNAPSIFSDISNKGENLQNFFAGAGSKTQKNVSLTSNVKNSFSFLAQGTTYVLTGFEPQKDWSKPLKLVLSKNVIEIFSALSGFLFSVFGIFLLYAGIRKGKDPERKFALSLIAIAATLSFFLFTMIGEELNLRFFIIVIFLPFIFLGLIFERFGTFFRSRNRHAMLLLPVVLSAIFLVLNVCKYERAYDLDDYKEKDSVYGGISVGEAREISAFMLSKASEDKNKRLVMSPFEFERSVEYFNGKSGLDVKSFSANDIAGYPVVFLVTEKNSVAEVLQEKSRQFELMEAFTTGRFTVLALMPKNFTYKIGFITDIHGELQKKSGSNLDSDTSKTLDFFNSQMNGKFKPDLVVQNGDLIDGTGSRGEESIQDFKFLTKHFSGLKMPFYNVLGNHDLRGFDTKTWLELSGNENPYYSIRHENLTVAVLSGNDTENIDDNSAYGISEKQFAWLEKTFSESDDLRKIVFIHYPVIVDDLGPGVRSIPASDADRLKKIFSKYGVSAVFSGHIEKLELKKEDGVQYFVIPGLKRSSNKAVQWYDSFAEITISDKLEIGFHYKKDRSQKTHQFLAIPSSKFDAIVK